MILGVVGYQDSGKTTLVELLIPWVTKAGFKVATIKHIAHDDLHIDVAGTDTHRHKNAGARLSVAVSEAESVYFHPRAHSLEEIIARIQHLERPDLILVEGFKGSDIPKIVIGNADHGGPAVYRWDGSTQGARAIGDGIVESLVEESFGRAMEGRRAEPEGVPTQEEKEGSPAPAPRKAHEPAEEQPEEPKRSRRFFRKG